MNGAEYIASFLAKKKCNNAFVVTGGACAFMIDAIARNSKLNYYPMQHEQSAAMAADALWKVDRKIGVTVATSGPGATNLITGIACSFFDSIPSIHLTGQVNQREKEIYGGTKVRQAGFQQTDIVEMVKPITKYSVQVTSAEELKLELAKAYSIAISGRMGPVLIDIPMDIQQVEVEEDILEIEPKRFKVEEKNIADIKKSINNFFSDSKRPLILLGAGPGLSDQTKIIIDWIKENKLPFVTSWNGMCFVDSRNKNYHGSIGVYGNRGSNFILQSSDSLLVLGSRLDNRQRGEVSQFAPLAKIKVLDIDESELQKHFDEKNYEVSQFDFRDSSPLFSDFKLNLRNDISEWNSYCYQIKKKYFGIWPNISSDKHNSLNPYDVVKKINKLINEDAIVAVDTGADLCWVFQAFERTKQTIFTAGGNSPMGYSFPAAIGSAILSPNKQIICFTGDGGMQMNIQEFQTMVYHKLPIKIFILNNFGYGIIKQFQDVWLEGRYEATGKGYSTPDFKKVSEAYGVDYKRIESVDDLFLDDLNSSKSLVFEVILNPNTLIEPKIDTGNPLHNQFPYLELEKDCLELKYLNE